MFGAEHILWKPHTFVFRGQGVIAAIKLLLGGGGEPRSDGSKV